MNAKQIGLHLPSGAQVSVIIEGEPHDRLYRASCYVLASPTFGTRGHGPLTFTASSPDFAELLGILGAQYESTMKALLAEQRVTSRKRRR